MTSSRMKVTTLVLLAASLFTPAIGWANNGPARSAPERSPATQLLENAPAGETTPAPASESEGYSKREVLAESLQDFKGGSFIYIGGSVAVVLLVVLLVILL